MFDNGNCKKRTECCCLLSKILNTNGYRRIVTFVLQGRGVVMYCREGNCRLGTSAPGWGWRGRTSGERPGHNNALLYSRSNDAFLMSANNYKCQPSASLLATPGDTQDGPSGS